jgi:hypothetical protein
LKLILDDEFKTQVGRAWGYRLVVFEDEIYAELDLILEQAYMDIHGSAANQQIPTLAHSLSGRSRKSPKLYPSSQHQVACVPQLPRLVCVLFGEEVGDV